MKSSLKKLIKSYEKSKEKSKNLVEQSYQLTRKINGPSIQQDAGMLAAVAKLAGANVHLAYRFVNKYQEACEKGWLTQAIFWERKIQQLLLGKNVERK